MNLRRLLLLTTVIFALIAMNVSFAKTIKISKELAEEIIKKYATETNLPGANANLSGDAIEEETDAKSEKSNSGDVITTSGDAIVSSGDIAVVASGDVIAPSGDNAQSASGDAKIVSGDAIVLSGDKANSGDKKSGDEVIVAKAEDVNEDRWYSMYVDKALKAGLMTLDEDNNFNPNIRVIKEDVVEGLYNLTDKDEESSKEWAIKNNIVASEEELDDTATREDISVLVYNYYKANGSGFKGMWMFLFGYEDSDQISDEGYEAVAWCVMNEIIIGKTPETINIQDGATRAELATILVRVLENINA